MLQCICTYAYRYKEVLPAVECFDGILFSAEVLCMKPQKEMYGHFFERFGLKPEECYFIDDLPNNIAGAKPAVWTVTALQTGMWKS